MIRRMVDRILEYPGVYATWQAPFADQKFAPVERALARRDVKRVLDVGCGPGTNATRFARADYVGIDINEHYLRIARSKHVGRFVCADLESEDLAALGSFDTILVNSVLHHLSDPAVERMMQQLHARLAHGGRIHVLELVLPDRLSRATVMAKLDRGRFPRTLGRWQELLAAHFTPVTIEPYTFGAGLWSMVYFQGSTR